MQEFYYACKNYTCDEVLVVSAITCVCILINAFIYKVMLI